jgi:hypothetical protein
VRSHAVPDKCLPSATSTGPARRHLADALADAGPAAAGGVRPDDARLLRHGSHAVFALGRVVARVGSDSPAARTGAQLALRVARWLDSAGFPAVRALADEDLAIAQPVVVDGGIVTFWHSLTTDPLRDPAHGSTHDLGVLLRRLHALEPPPGLDLQALDPVERITRQVHGAALTDGDRTFLEAYAADVASRYADLPPLLPPGHLHGDATVANVVLDAAGRPTLVDLDQLRTGPREWDLLRTAVYARRLGWHTEAEYRAFADAYGADVAAASGFDVLADLTELLQVAWLADAATARPELAGELGLRVVDLRAGRPGAVHRRWNRI